MIRTQIQLTKEQAEQLRALASERGLSMAELIRDGVDHVLDTSPRRANRQDLRDRARKLAGRFSSGIFDLAGDHDAHLTKIYAE
ncbi:MAG TPA: CopG family transcriptional regulator [Thermoanaerobaculia bacterium]|nr:CopG family transcriptional regulator [Thermoanaerobaculia bacterium]